MFALISDNQVSKYPINLRKEFPNISFPKDLSKATLPEGVVVVETSLVPSQKYSDVKEGTPTLQNGIWSQTWVITPHTDEQVKAELLAEVAQKKFQVTTGGITLNGKLIKTDDASQQSILSAIVIGKQMGLTSVDFHESDDSYTTISMDDLVAISNAIGTHKQQSFSAAKAHYEAIAAIVATQDKTVFQQYCEYDITTGWPNPTK